jgi:hypothetical protein
MKSMPCLNFLLKSPFVAYQRSSGFKVLGFTIEVCCGSEKELQFVYVNIFMDVQGMLPIKRAISGICCDFYGFWARLLEYLSPSFPSI